MANEFKDTPRRRGPMGPGKMTSMKSSLKLFI